MRALWMWWLMAFGLAWIGGPAVAQQVGLDALLKPDQHSMAVISPTGKYLAITLRERDTVQMIIVDRETMKPVRVLNPERDGAIARAEWVSPERIFVMNSRKGVSVEQSFIEPWIVAVNVDGSDKRVFPAHVVDTLIDDDANILVQSCAVQRILGCLSYVQKADASGGRTGSRLVDSPAINTVFASDNVGNVRLASSRDNDDVLRTWWLREGKWELLNDEAVSGVEVAPIGYARDGARAYLLAERLVGPDVVEEMDLATGLRRVVLSDDRLDPLRIVWSIDGRQPIGALYGLEVPRARFWNEADPDVRTIRQLESAFPEDAVQVAGASKDDRYAVVSVWSDRDPGSYYLLDRTTRKSALLVRAKPWLDPSTLVPTRSFSFTARDGTPLTGYLTLPVSVGGRIPMVVLPHGGPFGVADGWGYDQEVQILANSGYAVLRVNYRGSDGFGRAFETLGYRQWGGTMQSDIDDAVGWATRSDKIDAGRICIMGGSYGGYAALMAAIQSPATYRCVIATAAVSDLNKQWQWGDTQRSQSGRAYLARTMGDDPGDLLQRSPVAHAAAINAPVLLVHGRFDDRVSYEHVKALMAAFDKAGVRYETYLPKNETHGIYGEENQRTYYERVLAFLRKNLGDT